VNTATYKQKLAARIEGVKTGNVPTDNLLTTVIGALNQYTIEIAKEQVALAFEQAEKEVQDLHQRTKEGIQTARLNGKQIGQLQGKKLNVKKAAPAKEIIRKHSKAFGGTLNDAECMRLAGLARNTYYRYKREIAEQLAAEIE
jgi:DNA invertase Pin-like site-specific DNA recombinase